MKGKKIITEILDQVAGGVIKDGNYSMRIDGDMMIASDGEQTQQMSVADFKASFLDAGGDPKKVNKLISMISSDKNYDFKQIKEATGFDITPL